MSRIIGWYYLHENNELIYKNDPDAIQDIRDSDLCKVAWAMTDNREEAWSLLVEALAAGANEKRIQELADQWKFDNTDAIFYAAAVGCILGEDGNKKFAHRQDFKDPQESPIAYGDDYLKAMAALCKELGYKGDKLGWGPTFKILLKQPL